MSNRWCIVTDPRSGSHWLQSKLSSDTSLDEIINYDMYADSFHDYEFDSNNFIRVTNSSTLPLTSEEFIKKRIDQIKKINPDQHVTCILFCNNFKINYRDLITAFEESNFRFIMLERNLFDRTLSHCVASITHVAHRWRGHLDIPLEDSLGKITIDMGVWLESLFREYQSTEYRKCLLLNNKVVSVYYNNLIDDCNKNNIPIIEQEIIDKTWSVDYIDIVSNIEELKKVYNSFIKSIFYYSNFYLTYAK